MVRVFNERYGPIFKKDHIVGINENNGGQRSFKTYRKGEKKKECQKSISNTK